MLRNGFTVPAARRETVGAETRLWLCDGSGYIAIPSGQIERYEPAEGGPEPAVPAPRNAGLQEKAPATTAPMADLISGAAERSRIDPDFLASVIQAESGFNPGAVSPKGALGLMQLMPGTAAWLGIGNPFNPAENVEAGTKYLRALLDQYGGDAVKALAAYNAGPRRVEQYGGVPPYRETIEYITRIINDYNRKKLGGK